MTKWESLIKCRNHWQWLAITGDRIKRTYNPAIDWIHGCACCEYTSKVETYYAFWDCNECPLTGFSWYSLGETGYSFCDRLSNNSVYAEWKIARFIEDRQKYAQKMVDACNRAIEAYIRENQHESITISK